MPEEKRREALGSIKWALSADKLSLEGFQVLLGRLNNICQMSPFMRGFKGPLNKVLKQLHGGGTVRLSPESRRDLLCWGNFLS